MTNEEYWWVAEATKGGQPFHIRARQVPEDADLIGKFPTLITVTYSYVPNADGLPSDEVELATLEGFEDFLIRGLEEPGLAQKASIFTGNSARVFRYYTPSAEIFLSGLNRALEGHPKFPLTVKANADPNWDTLRQLNRQAHG